MSDDLRDQMPCPPCLKCGKGITEKSDGGGYVCPLCGEVYKLVMIAGPNLIALAKLGPVIVQFQMTTRHWISAMEQAFATLDHNSAMEAMQTYKKWLDEVGTPMIDCIRRVQEDDPKEGPLPPGEFKFPEGWHE